MRSRLLIGFRRSELLTGYRGKHFLNPGPLVDLFDPADEVRRVVLVDQLGETLLHPVGDGEVADVGQRIHPAGEPFVIGEVVVEPPYGDTDLAHLLVEQVLRESLARAAPFHLLLWRSEEHTSELQSRENLV